jgi:hypothetical protein
MNSRVFAGAGIVVTKIRDSLRPKTNMKDNHRAFRGTGFGMVVNKIALNLNGCCVNS